MVGDGVLLVAMGATLGLSASYALMRLLQSQVYGVTPTDPAIYFAVPAVLLASTLVAATIPAARAARVDPLTALEAE